MSTAVSFQPRRRGRFVEMTEKVDAATIREFKALLRKLNRLKERNCNISEAHGN